MPSTVWMSSARTWPAARRRKGIGIEGRSGGGGAASIRHCAGGGQDLGVVTLGLTLHQSEGGGAGDAARLDLGQVQQHLQHPRAQRNQCAADRAVGDAVAVEVLVLEADDLGDRLQARDVPQQGVARLRHALPDLRLRLG